MLRQNGVLAPQLQSGIFSPGPTPILSGLLHPRPLAWHHGHVTVPCLLLEDTEPRRPVTCSPAFVRSSDTPASSVSLGIPVTLRDERREGSLARSRRQPLAASHPSSGPFPWESPAGDCAIYGCFQTQTLSRSL